jgi:hypothetical protein
MPSLRLPVLALAGAATIALSGCGGATRPFVCARPAAMGDLYWNGAMNDAQGNRWDVDIIPGIAPTGAVVGHSWQRAGTCLANTGKRADGDEGFTRTAYRFGARDALRDFTVLGIRDDYRDTSHQLGALWRDMPFGWPAQWLGRTVWGYGLKPTGRLIGGTVTGVGAFALGTVTGGVEATGRAVYGVADIATVGTAYPVLRLAWQQPAYLFSIINREPDVSQDGHWGLHVVKWAAPKPITPTEPATARADSSGS